jgi:ketosteroid isomerase-like protein
MSNVQLAKDIYAAFGKGDIPTVLAAFSPDIEWHEAEGNPSQPDGSAWIGPQAVLENLFMRIGAEWDGFTITILRLRDAGQYVVIEGRYTGTYKPTGRKLDAQLCHVLRIQDGKLVGFQQYLDTAQLPAVQAVS